MYPTAAILPRSNVKTSIECYNHMFAYHNVLGLKYPAYSMIDSKSESTLKPHC